MYRLNLKGGASFFQAGCPIIRTPAGLANFNGVDQVITSYPIPVMLPTATLADRNVVIWSLGRTAGTALAAGNRIAFGMALNAPNGEDDPASVYEYSITGACQASVELCPFIGQTISASITANKGTGSTRPNESCFRYVPSQQAGRGHCSAQGTVIIHETLSVFDPDDNIKGNPIVMGILVTNRNTTPQTLTELDFMISGWKYDAPIDVVVPHPYSE